MKDNNTVIKELSFHGFEDGFPGSDIPLPDSLILTCWFLRSWNIILHNDTITSTALCWLTAYHGNAHLFVSRSSFVTFFIFFAVWHFRLVCSILPLPIFGCFLSDFFPLYFGFAGLSFFPCPPLFSLLSTCSFFVYMYNETIITIYCIIRRSGIPFSFDTR